MLCKSLALILWFFRTVFQFLWRSGPFRPLQDVSVYGARIRRTVRHQYGIPSRRWAGAKKKRGAFLGDGGVNSLLYLPNEGFVIFQCIIVIIDIIHPLQHYVLLSMIIFFYFSVPCDSWCLCHSGCHHYSSLHHVLRSVPLKIVCISQPPKD